MKKTLLSWSSGKDCAWALKHLRESPDIDLVGLLSVVNSKHDRVAMHATRVTLLQQQAEAVGLPLHIVHIPDPCPNEAYEATMGAFIDKAKEGGIECIAFGDLFLEDVRDYRIKQLAETGITPIFPLWGIPTHELAEQMLAAGVEAYISSVDLKKLPLNTVGRRWDNAFIASLPDGSDPCGEYGEIHTVVINGPMFKKRIEVTVGETVERDGFGYADIVPAAD